MNQTIGKTTTRLNLRAGPGTDYGVLKVLESGTMIVVIKDQGNWLNIQVAGTTGYVQEKYISLPDKPDMTGPAEDQAPLAAESTGVVTTLLNLRRGPGLEYEVIRTLDKGTMLDVLEDMGEWLNVHYQGTDGFVMNSFIEWEPQEFRETTEAQESSSEFPEMEAETPQEAEVPPAADESSLEEIPAEMEAPLPEEVPVEDEPPPPTETSPFPEEAVPLPVGLHTFGSLDEPTMLLAGPGQEFPALQEIPAGQLFRVLEDTGDWLHVLVGAGQGFVPEAEVSLVIKPFAQMREAADMRSGPGTDYEAVRTLSPGESLEIMEDLGSWLEISVQGQHGFIEEDVLDKPPSDLIELQDDVTNQEASVIPEEVAPLALQADPAHPLRVDPQAPLIERLIGDTWNRFADLILDFSGSMNVDPGVVVAVLAFETAGRSFDTDGRLIIRFENHVFWHFWGKQNQSTFDEHFQFDPEFPEQGHRFQADGETGWQGVHTEDQNNEWLAYELAASLDKTAARLSCSLGAPQIMGFNFTALGFENVDEMWAAFSAGEHQQIAGFFSFLKCNQNSAEQIAALKQMDFTGFARLFNGEGLAKKYGARIHVGFELFNLLSRP